MADYAQYFLQSADAAFQRKVALYDQILGAILSEELKTPALKKAEIDLLAREETRLRSMEEALREQQLQGFKSDADLLKVISEEQGGIAKANIAFNEAVITTGIRSKTELAIERSRQLRLLEEAALSEKQKADELKGAGITAAGGFGTGAFGSNISADAATAIARDYLTTLWDQTFDSRFTAAGSASDKQAVIDSFKTASADWMSRQGQGLTAAMLKDKDIQSAAIKAAIIQVGIPDSGKTAEQIIEEKKMAGIAAIGIPTVAGGGTKEIDENIILSRKEKLKTLLGIDESELSNLSVNLSDGAQTKFEDYLTTAAYNRVSLGERDTADAFYKRYPTAESFRAAIRAGVADPELQALVEETELLDASTLKQLYSGELATGYRELRRRQADLEAKKAALETGVDVGLTFEGAVEKARYLYRKLYGPEKIQTGLEAADVVRKELAGKSEEEVSSILSALPIDDRQKQILLKAAAGGALTDVELRKLQIVGRPGPTALSPALVSKLEKRLPGFVSADNRVLLAYDDTGMPVTKDVAELTLSDLGDAFVAYGEAKGEIVDPATVDKIKEAADLLEKLSKEQPAAAPMLNFQLEKSLDKMLEVVPGVVPKKLSSSGTRIAEEIALISPLPFNEAQDKRLQATRLASGDALTTASAKVKEKLGRIPRDKDIIKSVEGVLGGLTGAQKDLVVELGKQSVGLEPEDVQKNLSKIVNPLTDPSAYANAVTYLGIASNRDYNNLIKKDEAERIKRELRFLS